MASKRRATLKENNMLPREQILVFKSSPCDKGVKKTMFEDRSLLQIFFLTHMRKARNGRYTMCLAFHSMSYTTFTQWTVIVDKSYLTIDFANGVHNLFLLETLFTDTPNIHVIILMITGKLTHVVVDWWMKGAQTTHVGVPREIRIITGKYTCSWTVILGLCILAGSEESRYC